MGFRTAAKRRELEAVIEKRDQVNVTRREAIALRTVPETRDLNCAR